MRASPWLGILASLPLLSVYACTLTTDLDGFAGAPADAGRDGLSVADGAKPLGLDGGSVVEGGASDAPATDAGPTYGDLVMADHPVAYFPFDEPAGTPYAFEKMTGRQGLVEGTLFFGEKGIAGKALRSDGNGGIDFGDILGFEGGQAWTVEAWIYPVVDKDNTFYEYFNKRQGTSNGMVVYVRNEQQITAQVEQSFGGGGGRGVSIELPKLDHFIHIVFVFTPNKGVLAWTDGVAGTFGYNDPGGPTAAHDTHCFIASGIRGTIDEMAVYDYALSDERIAAHYAAGRATAK